AGIQLTIRSLEWGELLKRSKAGEHDLSLLGWAGDNGDPDNFLSPNLSHLHCHPHPAQAARRPARAPGDQPRAGQEGHAR
ncbi:hypothetical protein KQ765_15835, partial [Listeria monocytogenes]|nr:hypothetical protein [Listeria monocytogenes]